MSVPNPECEHCEGTGRVEAEADPPHPPSFNRCECVVKSDILENVERGLVGLSTAPPIEGSPLLDLEETNLWITAGEEFNSHLRHVAVRKSTTWALKVVSDAELVTAWLASVAINGGDILDADAYAISTRYLTIPDLVIPPDLLVIRMGVKVARNAASPEVLAEAINLRYHAKKPTWIWDEPHRPLNTGHLFWSDTVGRILKRWDRIDNLDAPALSGRGPKKKTRKTRASPGKPLRKTLRGGS